MKDVRSLGSLCGPAAKRDPLERKFTEVRHVFDSHYFDSHYFDTHHLNTDYVDT